MLSILERPLHLVNLTCTCLCRSNYFSRSRVSARALNVTVSGVGNEDDELGGCFIHIEASE
ncbi:hypothetical protein L227DRAFT_183363 [Lentinus tigrinus ALCF2SS1-6]|uniref:Uncharacterized protein n=1 Tax=Lentinus tigrinus ALCF2SS1-6 TaxID=1328759 RepID=A0A5C2S631_9APHY|nr:hypothetical protein L227DRAFT_183363 [Lentinus tigrinus ALCF2SS1-6]